MKKPSEPVPYFQKNWLSNIDERMALVVDPMLATGGVDDRHYRSAEKRRLHQHWGLVLCGGAGRDCRAGEKPTDVEAVHRLCR